jgi:hypothetical protein
MTKKGIQITCNGCGISNFIEESGTRSTPAVLNKITDGSHMLMYNENQSESWCRVVLKMDLCPKCQKIYEKMLCEFYERCGEARHDELNIIPHNN